MRYLCFCYDDQNKLDALSKSDLEAQTSVTEGPYAETAEPLEAFFIIEAEDMDEAVQVASKHPGTHLGAYFGGGIDVRPIDMLNQLAG
jgi:hypothetical protein